MPTKATKGFTIYKVVGHVTLDRANIIISPIARTTHYPMKKNVKESRERD